MRADVRERRGRERERESSIGRELREELTPSKSEAQRRKRAQSESYFVETVNPTFQQQTVPTSSPDFYASTDR